MPQQQHNAPILPHVPISHQQNFHGTSGIFMQPLTTTRRTTTTTERDDEEFFNNSNNNDNPQPPSNPYGECGLAEDTTPLVVHGKPTRSGQYPWLTAIFHLEQDAQYKFRCAGSLVSQTHIITGRFKSLNRSRVETYFL